MHLPDIGTTLQRLTSQVSRRSLIRGSAISATTAALGGVTSMEMGAGWLQAEGTPEPQLREFTLTASEFDWELMADVRVRVWGYNGQVPGPELRVSEGDTVRITLRNELAVPTTIHWHGLNVPNAMDGVAGLNQAPVEPGGEFVYEFVATPAGTRWYHSHTDPHVQVAMGLYGSLIVEPRTPAERYDREYTMVLAEWDLELTPDVATGLAPRGPGDAQLRGGELGADLFLINGKMHGAIPPLMVNHGETILVRLINAGARPHPIHTHGHSFRIVATDGNPVPVVAQWTKDTVLIGPAERYDLAFTADNPGVWMVHCHIENHMANGMMTTIWYEGHEPTGPVGEAAAAEATAASDDMHHMHEDPTPEPVASPTVEQAPAGSAEIVMVDDRFEPGEITVPAGTTVTWVNKGSRWHSVANLDLRFTSGKIFPGESYSYQFTEPGVYSIYCQHHAMAGMNGVVTVV
jgi:FtsP/CotA-like multicopper oxidase with cupredoxin domain